ncbi:hypothetical protein BC827DRAFT_1164287 [Russula dissimulans]|nr:hypothetical protein BC827DRAFT_1164287 [Russula dissimulans]
MQATGPVSVFALQALLPAMSPPSCPVSNLLENSQTCPTSATTASALYTASLTNSTCPPVHFNCPPCGFSPPTSHACMHLTHLPAFSTGNSGESNHTQRPRRDRDTQAQKPARTAIHPRACVVCSPGASAGVGMELEGRPRLCEGAGHPSRR